MFSHKYNILILIALQIFIGFLYLSNAPRIYIDEVWDTALGYNLARNGSIGHPFIEGFGGMHISFVQSRLVLPFVCAGVFKFFEYNIFTIRFVSVLFGAIAVVCLYGVISRWYGQKQALLTALATIIHPWFFEVSRRARPEIYYTALALAFLWLIVLYSDSGSRPTAFFAGFVAGLSALTHPNGVIIIFSISLAVIIWQRTKSIGRLIIWSGLGLILVIIPYAIYVLWAIRDPQVSFAEQMQLFMLNPSFLDRIYAELSRWKRFFYFPKGTPLAFIFFVSWLFAWFRSSATDKTIATIVAFYVLILPFAAVNNLARYLVVIVPFVNALVVRMLWRIMARGTPMWKNWYRTHCAVGLCIVAVYLILCFNHIGAMLYHLHRADFYKVIDRVASVVEPDSRVYGDPIFWLGHNRYNYGPYPIFYKGKYIRDAVNMVRKHNFDYAIRTPWEIGPPTGIARPPRSIPKFRNTSLCDHVCRIFGTKIDEFYDPYYGYFEIYKLDWNKPRSAF